MKTIYTIGHSTHPIDEFLEWLKAHQIALVIDIRTIPYSSFCPQFGQKRLQKSLEKAQIEYCHLKQLGGLRHARKDSINTSWKNASFRGYADYMQTEQFALGLKALEKLAKGKRAALMCSEAVPWRCHRNLVADALTVKRWKVFHIQSKKKASLHHLTPFLRVRRKQLVYDG
jgi:uncharacterized protein (DUF488 family)